MAKTLISIGLFCATLSFTGLLSAQDTTITYFDADWEKCEKGSHTFFGKSFKTSESLWGKLDYYKNGQLQMSGCYKTEEMINRHGEFIFFNENGDTSKISDYVDGEEEGKFIEFYDNGKPSVRTQIINGKQEGKTFYYHKTGELSSEGMFKDGTRVGEWKYYDESGTYISSEHFIQNYLAPCGYKLSIPPGWIHVSKDQYGKVGNGISLDRIFRKNIWTEKGKEQFFALDAIGFNRPDLTANQVCLNMMKGQKVKYKKIKKYKGLDLDFTGEMYTFTEKQKNGQKLTALLFAQNNGDNIAQLKFLFDAKVDPEVLKEIATIVNSLSWD